jgi:hypothetical protein
MELHGVEYIGLGAVASELTAEQRVRDTVAQLTEQNQTLNWGRLPCGYKNYKYYPSRSMGA